MFAYNFDIGVNFCRQNFCGNRNFLPGNFFLRIAKKPAKIEKITTCKNLVPHGSRSGAPPLFLIKVSKFHLASRNPYTDCELTENTPLSSYLKTELDKSP